MIDNSKLFKAFHSFQNNFSFPKFKDFSRLALNSRLVWEPCIMFTHQFLLIMTVPSHCSMRNGKMRVDLRN